MKEWINDGLMTLFFFLVALELKRELVLGELGHPRVAALSIAAAVGGMLVPAAVSLMLQAGQSGASGWGTVMATDTAFVIGTASGCWPRRLARPNRPLIPSRKATKEYLGEESDDED